MVEIRDPNIADPFYWFSLNFVSHKMQLMNKYNVACGKPIDLKLVLPVLFSTS